MRRSVLLGLALVLAVVAGAVAWTRLGDVEHLVAHGEGSESDLHLQEAAPPRFTVRTVRDGAWSDPNVWSGGAVPTPNDAVALRHSLRLDARRAEVRTMWVTGALAFPTDRSSALTLNGSLVILDGGEVLVGAPGRPVARERTAAIRFRVKNERSFVGGPAFHPEDTGLWVLDGGRLDLHGAPVLRSWSELASTAGAGARELLVEEDVTDWPTPARAVLSATNMTREDQNEIVSFRAAEPAGDGRTRLILERPLEFSHLGEPGKAGEVGLLARNVSVSSVDPKNRAHVMFMGGSTGAISHARFHDLGPKDVFGRYMLHFHLMGDSARGIVVRGSSFERAGRYWFNIHGSNGITAVDNVGYFAHGSGYYMEQNTAGWDNTWLHNLGVSVAPSQNLRHRNSVFWFLLGNRLVDNVAVGAHGGADSSGFFLTQLDRDERSYGEPTVILRNEGHSNRQYGLASWMNLSPEFDVVDMELWRNGDAGFHWGAYGTRFRSFRIHAFDNAEYDLEIRVKNAHLQDSVLSGAPVGIFFANPVVDTNPEKPSRIVRTVLEGHDAHDVSVDDRRECKRKNDRCPPMYVSFVDSALGSERPVRFGWQWDPETRIAVEDSRTPHRPDLPDSFVLRRPDVPRPSPDAFRDPAIGAWVVQQARESTGEPPRVETPTVRRTSEGYELSVRASDDDDVKTVEFLVNGQPVVSRAGGGTVSARWQPRAVPAFRYLTVRVTDGSEQVTYSPTVEIP